MLLRNYFHFSYMGICHALCRNEQYEGIEGLLKGFGFSNKYGKHWKAVGLPEVMDVTVPIDQCV